MHGNGTNRKHYLAIQLVIVTYNNKINGNRSDICSSGGGSSDRSGSERCSSRVVAIVEAEVNERLTSVR